MLVLALSGGAAAEAPMTSSVPTLGPIVAQRQTILPADAEAGPPLETVGSGVRSATDGTQAPPEAAAAPAALLVDLSSGRTLYSRAPDQRFVPASVTKVMTLYTAFDLLSQGKLRPDQLVPVSDRAWDEWHAKGSRMFLARGSLVSVNDLLMGIANVSANDGCIVLAEGAAGSVPRWVALMNAEARLLGMTGSHFGTPNGWMDEGNTYYTARDLVRLTDAMITRFPGAYHRYIGHKGMTWNGITQANHDPTLGIVPGADGIKTGFTDEAHYTFLGSAERDGRRLVLVLAGVPTARERAMAARALLEWGFTAWDALPLFTAGAQVGTADVQEGDAASVRLVTPRAYFTAMPHGEGAPVSVRVVYRGPLLAPIARGAHVADLQIRVGAAPAVLLPLLAGGGVARGNAFDRLRAGLHELLR
jgi:D-alanyl-D-alanine carboxypeptidase (penicillin-binding protein 5/6)